MGSSLPAGLELAHFVHNTEMTASLQHFQGNLFISNDGAVVDANRLMQEIDREKDQAELYRDGYVYTALARTRKPVQHISGTIMKDTETDQTFDVTNKHRLLLALREQNKELFQGLVMRDLAREFFEHRLASCEASKQQDTDGCLKFTAMARDVANRYMKLTGLKSVNDAVLAMRSMRTLGDLH